MTSESDTAGSDPGTGVYDWQEVIRRANMSWDLKAFALLLASYADPDGTKIYPGEDRLTVVTGKSRSTIQRHLRVLRELGLVEMTRRGSRKSGKSDEYRLILADDIDARLKIPSKDEHTAAVQAIKAARSKRHPRDA